MIARGLAPNCNADGARNDSQILRAASASYEAKLRNTACEDSVTNGPPLRKRW
jgi:hypothetical protein